MPDWESGLGGIVVALGIGLLVGVERERSKGTGPGRGAAGVRTFVLVALLGAVSAMLDSIPQAALLGSAVVLLAVVSYWRSPGEDPGITTEIALVVTYALGVLAMAKAGLAAGLGVLAALVLVSRSRLHAFVGRGLTDQEVLDGILLAASALIVLPLLPDRAADPYGVVNPQLIWRLTVLVLLVNAFGYVALRMIGASAGMGVAGLVGGFVSSAATIGTLGMRLRTDPTLIRAVAAGATLSSVATVVQLALVLAVANPGLLVRLVPALASAGVVAVACGALFAWLAARGGAGAMPLAGRAFQPRFAVIFAATFTAFLYAAAFLADHYGDRGATLGIALAGFADVHSASASAARLLEAGDVDARAAIVATTLAFAANSATKLAVAWKSGGGAYFRAVAPAIVLMLAAFAFGAYYAGT